MANDYSDLHNWLHSQLGSEVELTIEGTETGNVNNTVFVEVNSPNQPQLSLVAKTASEGGSVRRRPDVNEAIFLQALHQADMPVPEVLYIDQDKPMATPRFVMRRVEGDTVPDEGITSYVGGGWLAEASPDRQCKVWRSFHQALAAMHSVSVDGLASMLAQKSHADNLEFWRESIMDVCSNAPAQTKAIDWLLQHAPTDVDQFPAICMCDSRLANAIVSNDDIVALVDFELAYVGNPAADIAYSLFTDRVFSDLAGGNRLDGFLDADATWALWESATGRRCHDRGYWGVHAAMVLCITASRMINSMVEPGTFEESMNPFVDLLNDHIAGVTL